MQKEWSEVLSWKRQNCNFFQQKISVQMGSFQKSGGYSPTLAIASNEHALATMVHEYCHMLQYLEVHPVWAALEGRGQMWSWLNGEDFPDEVIDESVESYMNVELDCEIRSVEFHRMWNTGINLEEYIQRANSYILFYKFLREERNWYKPQREPYTLHAVWSQMPKTFDFDHEDWYNNNRSIFSTMYKRIKNNVEVTLHF